MPSSLFQNQPQNNLFERIKNIKSAMQGNPQALFNNMLNNNPQFRQFAESMQGKTPEEAFKQFGYDFNEIKNLMK